MKHGIMKHGILAIIIAALAASPATAYTSYLKPDRYWPEESEVTVQGSFASQFFAPQIAVPAQINAVGPDGAPVPFDRVAVEGASTTLDANLRLGGTYRFSTGEQVGAAVTLVAVDGQWRALASGEAAPEGAQTTTLQAITVADVYVTRGTATREVVDRPHGRLAIRPITHPNQVLAADGLQVEILFDNAPLVNTAVVLYSSGDIDTDLDTYVVTDASGRAFFTLPGPGHYVIAARHRADLPPGADAQVGSYTTTLTFEALAVLPAGYDVAAREAEAARDARRREPPRRRRVGRWE